MYIIKGSKVVICEIKYSQSEVDATVVAEMEKKVALFKQTMPAYRNYTFDQVLITTEGIASIEVGDIYYLWKLDPNDPDSGNYDVVKQCQ